MGRKSGKGKYRIYVGLRCDEETVKAMEKKAESKHDGEIGHTWRAAARAYCGLKPEVITKSEKKKVKISGKKKTKKANASKKSKSEKKAKKKDKSKKPVIKAFGGLKKKAKKK